ncbi:penicillin-binding protein 2 [Nereida sp. MMG025]|uniref:penicillin-binding protein 2 n=1 Tax=Nereida sp. MMG025 TaxID=2909981 RepID=UPI001F018F36|nr:penicillin-binding protein 2 [Nereida sp. MMG025]MCF6444174.1 penicillin-binding protein 2 [Nereida sp. MMG025]
MKRPTTDPHVNERKIGRRAFVFGAAQLGILGVLGYRMRELQIKQADQYRLLADENRINIRLIPPARGRIFDRNGLTLADNEPNYRITIVRDNAGDVEEVLHRLSRIVTLTPEQISEALETVQTSSPFVPVTILDRLTWDDIAEVSANAPALPGITADLGLSRYYPVGNDFAHVVGYVGRVTSYHLSRIDDNDPVLRIPDFQIGLTGVEVKEEKPLRGKAGTRRIEVNARGRMMRELDRVEAIKGDDIQLTVDTGLQNFVQARLAGEAASAIVMDVETGDLLAVGSAPTFDPNLFVRGISTSDYNALLNDKYRPFRSKAIQDIYPPGSTFKMITALAAFEDGQVDLNETVRCVGHKEVADVRFHCWKRAGHGNVNLHKSLKESCDVYYYDLALRVGIDKIAEMARKFGIGVRHDIPMSAVARGLAPDKAWKREVREEDWRIGDTVNASIGQGYVLSSPLHLAVMTARLASGRAVEPRLVKSRNGVEVPIAGNAPIDVNPNTLEAIRKSMYAVCNTRGGTAYASRTTVQDFRMAGKTGTSQVRRITAAERARGVTRNEDLPWERRDHALWVNYAPYDNPKYAVAVIVEHGGGGSKAAAPIGRDITLRALYGRTPPLEAYPSRAQASARATLRRMEPLLRDFDTQAALDADKT